MIYPNNIWYTNVDLNDVEGIDSAYKITLLASLCYGLKINHNYSSFCGIKNFNKEDIKYSKKLGFRIKLISDYPVILTNY